MGNLNCNNSTLDNQTEIRSADIDRNNTLVLKHNNLKISSPIRTMIKSKSCPPKDKLSLKEKNYIFSEKIKSIETKNNTKISEGVLHLVVANNLKYQKIIKISMILSLFNRKK
jgi:hypothetical protein